MKLLKYSKTIGSDGGTSTRGGGSSTTSSNVELDRTIWGQNDSGDDIDGSMVVNGNVTIQAIVPPTYDDEDGSDGDDIAEETGGGNLTVELKITSNEVEANDIYAKQHLYIPHPTTKAKTDIVELLKGYDTRITNNSTNIASNKTEIDALKGRVSTAETNITNLTSKVNNNTTAITNNTTNIQANADDIQELRELIAVSKGDQLPLGTIIMFNGAVSKIPKGWSICDGTNGTPNLIDRFVKASNSAGVIGGADSFTLTVGNLPPHSHNVLKTFYGRSDNANDRNNLEWTDGVVDTTNQVKTSVVGSGLPIYFQPKYYSLIFIMKTS